jgi:hypothetical protein
MFFMKPWTRKLLIGFLVGLAALGIWGGAQAQEEDYSHLCEELKTAGFEIVDSGVAYGVPFATIRIHRGFSITSLCHQIPSFEREFNRCRNRLSFFNALNPSFIKTMIPQPNSIEADTLKIPLDLRRVPEIFPAYDEGLAAHEKYLLVDVGKGFLALYEQGELRRVFPLSAGASGRRTPLFDFYILSKDEDHWSNIYESWMPWALHLKGAYYIHGGVLPGQADSHGCIRLPIDNAEQLFKAVDKGTPGRIIDTPKVDRDIFPASFCR